MVGGNGPTGDEGRREGERARCLGADDSWSGDLQTGAQADVFAAGETLVDQVADVRAFGRCEICGRCRGRLVVAEELELGQLRRAREPSISLLGSIANSYDPPANLAPLAAKQGMILFDRSERADARG